MKLKTEYLLTRFSAVFLFVFATLIFGSLMMIGVKEIGVIWIVSATWGFINEYIIIKFKKVSLK